MPDIDPIDEAGAVAVEVEVRIRYPKIRRKDREVLHVDAWVDDRLAARSPGLVLVELLNLLEQAKAAAILKDREKGL